MRGELQLQPDREGLIIHTDGLEPTVPQVLRRRSLISNQDLPRWQTFRDVFHSGQVPPLEVVRVKAVSTDVLTCFPRSVHPTKGERGPRARRPLGVDSRGGDGLVQLTE